MLDGFGEHDECEIIERRIVTECSGFGKVVWTFGESGCGVRCEQCFIAFEVCETSLFGS